MCASLAKRYTSFENVRFVCKTFFVILFVGLVLCKRRDFAVGFIVKKKWFANYTNGT